MWSPPVAEVYSSNASYCLNKLLQVVDGSKCLCSHAERCAHSPTHIFIPRLVEKAECISVLSSFQSLATKRATANMSSFISTTLSSFPTAIFFEVFVTSLPKELSSSTVRFSTNQNICVSMSSGSLTFYVIQSLTLEAPDLWWPVLNYFQVYSSHFLWWFDYFITFQMSAFT